MPNRIWIIARNDGEAIELLRLLEAAGETLFVSEQPWGACWQGLEREIAEAVRVFREGCPNGEIYGVELQGRNDWGAIDVDHHRYAGDDRRHELSALEQVAKMLDRPLSRWQTLVALNDRGYIPALQEYGASDEEIEAVRRFDRGAQGLTEADEARAEADLVGAEWRGDRARVLCAVRPTSAHADRLFGRAKESLLTHPSEWNYYGRRHRGFAGAGYPEKTQWSGGSDSSGYFGVAEPSEETQRLMLTLFWR